MRIGEAIRLDQHDFDSDSAVITIRQGKFGKSRELPLHSSVVAALSDYLHRADRPRKLAKASAIFLSPTGTQTPVCQRAEHLSAAPASRRHHAALGNMPATAA